MVPRAEGHTAGDLVDIGAAADGLAVALFAGVGLVGGKEGADKVGVGIHGVGRPQTALTAPAVAGKFPLHHIHRVLLGGAQRIPGVEDGGKARLRQGQKRQGQGQHARLLVLHGNAQSLPPVVAVGEAVVEPPDRGLRLALGQIQAAQRLQRGRNGVLALVRGGGVGLNAHSGDGQGLPFRVCRQCYAGLPADLGQHLLDLGRIPTGNHRLAVGRGHIFPNAALQGQDLHAASLGFLPGLGEFGAVACLFDVDDREIRIRGQGVGGKGMGRVVVFNIPGARLLIGAHDQLHVFRQRQLQLPDAAHGKHGSHQRALVVIGAPAIDQVPVSDQLIGVRIPAVSGPYHIQVGQDVQAVRGLHQVRRSHVALLVFHRKAPFFRQLQSPVQSQGRALPKGHTGLRLPQGGLRFDQRPQGLYQLILPVLHPVGDPLFCSHGFLPPVFFWYYTAKSGKRQCPRTGFCRSPGGCFTGCPPEDSGSGHPAHGMPVPFPYCSGRLP